MDSNYIDKRPLFGWLLQHDFYAFGTPQKISWVLKNDQIIEQARDHVDMYLNKVNQIQSTYIALHVGIFWCIGTFRIKNEDTVNVILDSKKMHEHLTNKNQINDKLIENRTKFLNQLIHQRKLKIQYLYNSENLARKLIK